MDRRRQKTRNAVFDAFGALLSSKSYSAITVQQIIDKADIGRTTFYSHFQTKDDLLKEMCTDLFEHVFSEDLSAESTHDFSMQTGDPHAMITHILCHLLDNKRNIIGILTCESGELFLGFFRRYLNELMAVRLLGDFEYNTKKVSRDFLLSHITGSFISMVQWWIKNKLRQTPEELTECFMAVIIPALPQA